jgi:glycosyltransferase involved in cell wall biosynthesis
MSTIVLFRSTDRPLQLDAALRSFARHCRDLGAARVKVLYRATTSRQGSLYRQLAREHPDADFIPRHPFKSYPLGSGACDARDHRLNLLLPEGSLLLDGHGYACIVSDLAVFIRDFSIGFFADCLRRHTDSLGCLFGLCDPDHGRRNTKQRARRPDFHVVDAGIIKCRWADSNGCFACPFESPAALYRTSDLVCLCGSRSGDSEELAPKSELPRCSPPTFLCPDEPLTVQLPVSAVPPCCSGHLDEFSARFAAGCRIDLAAIESQSIHPAPAIRRDIIGLTEARSDDVPVVSVVVPCYDQARYLPEAVAGVIAQSFDDWELIIVNDGSPDDTDIVARRLIHKHPNHRIRLIEQKNGGLSHARNTGIRAARGAYILPVDADDYIAANMLELMVPLLMKQPHVGIVYCDLRHFGAVEKVVQAPEYDFRALCERNGVSYCSLFRREAWEAVGGYNRNMIWSYEDRDFWIACGREGFFAERIPEVLLNYRVKAESMYTNAVLHDRENRARIVLNHPSLYSHADVARARAIWGDSNISLPPNIPKVSIIVTTRDRPAGLQRTLLSVLDQRFEDLEIIVVNDGGIDVQHVLARLPAGCLLTHVRHSFIRGIAAARNTGLRLAGGKYVIWLNDQDPWTPNRFHDVIGFLERTGCRSACIQPNRFPKSAQDGHLTAHDAVDHQPIPWRHLVCERSLAIAAGDFDESLGARADWDYWRRLSRICQPVRLGEGRADFRLPLPEGNGLCPGERVQLPLVQT